MFTSLILFGIFMIKIAFILSAVTMATSLTAYAEHVDSVSDDVIAEQRENLATNTKGKGFGPQSPRDINSYIGQNLIKFNTAPAYTEMNLCNIHFHKNAEHSGGEFTKYAGNGDGHGHQTGFLYSGELTKGETKPLSEAVCSAQGDGLQSGDTIEIHYVHSSAQIEPGPTLGACLSESIMNPQLRVEAQVYALVNDDSAADFAELTAIGQLNGYHQAIGIPNDTGTPVEYAGATTGPSYNEKGSPLQVTWSVRPKVVKVNIDTVGEWCKNNEFNEYSAQAVRNLVINPDLLSPM
jgi:hypothetical protein